jgi:hypothetical protein
MRSLRLALFLTIVTGLHGASKQSEADLRRTVAAQAAQLAAAAKEKAQLQAELKTAALAHEQLAEAAQNKARTQAALDSQAAKDRAAQQDAVRVAAQTAADATAQQAQQAVTKAAAKNNAELGRALATVNANSHAAAVTAAEQHNDSVKAIDANTEQAHQDAESARVQAANIADTLALKIEEVKQRAHHDNLLLYMSALGSVLGFGSIVLKFFTDRRLHNWSTGVVASSVAKAAKSAVVEGLASGNNGTAPESKQ